MKLEWDQGSEPRWAQTAQALGLSGTGMGAYDHLHVCIKMLLSRTKGFPVTMLLNRNKQFSSCLVDSTLL